MSGLKDNYLVFPEQKLIVERLEGLLNLENLAEVKRKQDADEEFDPSFDLLADIRSTEVKFSPEELKLYAQFLETTPLTQFGRKFALLTNSPMQVAIASLIQSKTRHLSQQIEIFSTLSSALSWLNVETNLYEDVELLLDDTLV